VVSSLKVSQQKSLIAPMLATCPAHLILLDLITLIRDSFIKSLCIYSKIYWVTLYISVAKTIWECRV
jgi:hypothetical protein